MAESDVGTVLVTGANRGIGREIARQLADHGWHVLLGAREGKAPAPAHELESETGGNVTPVTLDVSDADSIAAAVDAVKAIGSLDALVNNAGIGTDFGVAGTDPDFDAMQTTLETNFFGAYRLTVGLLDLLRKSSHPRIVNVSSGMGGVAEMGAGSPGYRVSKAAMNAMTRILATELAADGVLVNAASPGFVNTDMGGPLGATKSAADGAAGIVQLVELPNGGPTGGFFRDGEPIPF